MHRTLKFVLQFDPEIEWTARKLRKQRSKHIVEESKGENSVVNSQIDLMADGRLFEEWLADGRRADGQL